MAPLTLPTPTDVTPKTEAAFDEVIAPLQTWAGKVDGMGKWVDYTPSNAVLRVDGTGNSWTVGSGVLGWTYALTTIGPTSILSFVLTNTALTIATAVNSLYLKIPGDRLAALYPGSTQYARSVATVGWANNGGTPEALYLTVSDRQWIGIARLSFANWATVASLTVEGQIILETEP